MTKLLLTVFVMLDLTVSVGSWVAHHSGAQLMRADEHGGQVQLVGAHVPAMADARTLIASQCPGGAEYAEGGRIVEFRCAHADVHGRPELAMR